MLEKVLESWAARIISTCPLVGLQPLPQLGNPPWLRLLCWDCWGAATPRLRSFLAWWLSSKDFPTSWAPPHRAIASPCRQESLLGREVKLILAGAPAGLAWKMPCLDTPGKLRPPPQHMTLLVPEACPGVCSQPPRSGIWTPLYNLPKGKMQIHLPSSKAAGATEGRTFSLEEARYIVDRTGVSASLSSLHLGQCCRVP